MSTKSREELLGRVTRSQGQRPEGTPLDWDDIGLFVQGLAFASRPLHKAAHTITQRYDLGHRGAWVLNLVSAGIVYPHELADVFQIGRSLMSSELSRLTEAGLIKSTPGTTDRRRSELALTELGGQALAEVRQELAKIVTDALAGYSPAQIRLCAQMLSDLRNSAGPVED